MAWNTKAQRQSDFWLEIQESQLDIPADLEPAANVKEQRLFWLDMAHIRQTLDKAPMEFENSHWENKQTHHTDCTCYSKRKQNCDNQQLKSAF